MTRRVAGLIVWTLLLLTAGVPLAWLAANLAIHPRVTWDNLAPQPHHLVVFARTLALAAAGAAGATLLAIAPAGVLARGGWPRWLLWSAMAALLVMPSPAWAYGWAEFVRQHLGGTPRPQSAGDLARVAMTNAAAYWPIPAAAIGLAWRRLPASVLESAALDGARKRMTARLLVGPALAGLAGALLLCTQNLSAPDLSGIVVASVVVRDAFQLGGGDQSARLAAATAAGLVSFLAPALLALAGWHIFRRSTDWGWVDPTETRIATPSPPGRGWPEGPGEGPAQGGFPASDPHPPRRLGTLSRRERGSGASLLALVILLATLLPPFIALLRTNDGLHLASAFDTHGPDLLYGLQLSAASAAFCGIAALMATLAPARGPMLLSLAAFLLGGQFLALGMIRAYNPPDFLPQLTADLLGAFYDTFPYYAAANIALFAWLALAAARGTWHGHWRTLRDMACADGAGPVRTGVLVIWPLAWPGLLAATLVVLGLSLTESQAAALLVPGTPMNFMLSNLHTLNYPAMAEASLLMSLVCGGGALLVVLLWVGARSLLARRGSLMLPALFCLLCLSCDRPPPPEAVWASGGAEDGQLAYPRAITYSPADDTVWVVDKNARIQHFDSEGRFINGWDMPESTYGKPVGLGTDAEGNLWVADTHYYRVIVFRPDGTEWFRFGEQGIGPGKFTWPTDVLVLDDGRVLVSEYGAGGSGASPDNEGNDRIQVFQRSPDGTITDPAAQVVGQIGSFGTGHGQFRRPQSMAMLGDVLWVTDGANHRLVAFDLEGRFLKAHGGGAGSGAGQFRFPYGLDVDDKGKLLVAEFGNHRVQKIDPETGQSLATWGGSFGGRPGQVKYPWGLAYDPLRDRVIVLDSGNDRMQVIRMPD